jgi:hypothetical protein
MVDRSPFTVATAPAAPVDTTPAWGKDLFIANAAHTPEADLLTVSSMADRNMKEYLTTEAPNKRGYSIGSIEWSDKPGQTKATVCKDGQCATIGFNEALLSQPPGAPPPIPRAAPVVAPAMAPGAMPTPHIRGVIQRLPQKLTPEQQKEIEAKAQQQGEAAPADGVKPEQ